jgi:hypothetical protein
LISKYQLIRVDSSLIEDWFYVQSLGHDLRARFGCYKVGPVDLVFEQHIGWCQTPDKMARN